MNPSHLILVFISASLAQNESCFFNDDLLFDHQPKELGPDGAFERRPNPRNQWDDVNNKIPYYFKNVINSDKRTVLSAMKKVEENTCITFREMTDQEEIKAQNHRLLIQGFNGRCTGGSVAAFYGMEVVLELKGQGCPKGLVLHELGHVLGLMHTHKRYDRDEYITVDTGCLRSQTQSSLYQYKKVEEHLSITHGVPYMCNSIMHYNEYGFNRCPVLKAKPGLECATSPYTGKPHIGKRWDGEPIPEDWELINRQHCSKQHCVDKDDHCPYWANDEGYCQGSVYSTWMIENCKKSCNTC